MPRSPPSRASSSRSRASRSSPAPRSPSSTRRPTASPRPSTTARARPRRITVDRVISAVGVVGNVENLGLEKLGVKIERGTIVDRRLLPDQRARHLRHRRRRRPADAGAQGRARGRHLRRGDQGPASRIRWTSDDPRLHLLHAAGRLGRPHRAGGEGRRSSTFASAAFRSSATARRSRSARTRAWSR